MSFGKNLKRLRTERRLSQAEVAAAASIYQSMISAIESGEKNPSLATASAIANFLKVSLDELSSSDADVQGDDELVPMSVA